MAHSRGTVAMAGRAGCGDAPLVAVRRARRRGRMSAGRLRHGLLAVGGLLVAIAYGAGGAGSPRWPRRIGDDLRAALRFFRGRTP